MRFPTALIFLVLTGHLPVAVSSASAQEKQFSSETLPKLGEKFLPQDVDLDRPVFETSFESADILKRWRLEGGKQMRITDGSLILESDLTKKREDGKCNDHLDHLTKSLLRHS